MIEWINKNWFSLFVPLIVFFSFLIFAFWTKARLFKYINFKIKDLKWNRQGLLSKNLAILAFYWILISGAYTAIELSSLKGPIYVALCRIFLTMFFGSLIYVLYRIITGIVNLYAERIKEPLFKPFQKLKTVLTMLFIVIGVLILFEIWNFPTTSFILFIIIGCAVAFFAFKEELSNLIAGFEIINGELIKKGDYIKLETGEEGNVLNITWRYVEIKTFDEKVIVIPNSRITKTKIEIFRKSSRKAKEPFRFYTRLNIKEIAGVKAKNLHELLRYIKDVPDSVIFYHTHDFIEEYHYLTPQPSNEFALWIGNTLGYDMLSEKLSTVDIFEFSSIGELRKRIADIIEEYINNYPSDKNCEEGEEFHFIKSVSAVIPTPYVAHDLREFVQILKFIGPNSLFFHIYEAKLRLGKISNDFSMWLSESLGEKELAEKIMNIDPYLHTIEGIREKLITTIQEHINAEA